MDPPPSSASHIVVVPFVHQGHVIPALQLAVQLASSGATVTFVNTERNQKKFAISHPSTDFAHQQSAAFDLRFATISDGLPLDFQEGPPPDRFPDSGHSPPPWDARHREPDSASDLAPFGHGPPHGHPPPPDHVADRFSKQGPALEKLIQDLQTEGPRVSCLITDEFMPWAAEVALKLNIPWVMFWTSSAAWLCATYGEMKDEHPDTGSSEGSAKLPGLPFRGDHLASHPPPPKEFKHHMQEKKAALKKADCILANACEELEREAFAAIPLDLPVWSVGPLILGATSKFDQLHGGFSKADEECIPWLDTQEADSVLYISFGSRSLMSKEQLTELAQGIEASGKPFLWVEGRAESLPEGFGERTKSVGKVVSWAPQRGVLGHASVGAFMTHCGWNSILETMARGVPMVCWPGMADQPTHRVLVEEQWRVGKGLFANHGGGMGPAGGGHGEGRKLVPGSRVSEVVKEVMEDEELRQRARLLSRCSKAAMAPEGSSSLHLQAFLRHISASSPP